MTTSIESNESPEIDVTSEEFRDCFLKLEPEIRAVPQDQLLSINLEVQSAVTTALGVVPEVRQLRPAIVEQLPHFDIEQFDRIRDAAMALGYTHAIYRSASGPPDNVTELAAETVRMREVLHNDAVALATRKLLDGARVAKLFSASGYKNIAFDVLGLVEMFRESSATIHDKTAVREEELKHAARLANRLLTAVGAREQGPVAIGAAAELRQRAFTVFMRAYDDARRAVVYLRWHEGDGDAIAPSLYAGRSNGRRSATEAVPVAGPSSPAAVPAPAATAPSPAASADHAASVPAGLPGSNPFMNP